ncbi:hypothetical protein OSB04_010271 [Centaurea solstitialis]|uniref:RING-type E3 ubiquitin transferase n=1 Tax=Centaurea solstitialis TaxID=347529 RepID=A0AA38TQB0_9ASTR|nr:hypothetical protein OSB04_010271 [Centaurea solstitialis]
MTTSDSGSGSDFSYRYPTQFLTHTVTKSFLRSHPTNCVICMDAFELKTNVTELIECGHCFHDKCIFGWLSKSNTCPVCRCRIRLVTPGSTNKPTMDRLTCQQTSLIEPELEIDLSKW